MNTARITHKGSPERFDPQADGGKLVHSEHIARYRWAAQLAAGVDVLDAGCGTGYGTAILAGAEPRRLLAVDIAEEAVELTREVTAGRAETVVADLRALPFADDSVDLVVCFEVIEHLERRDEALREFARVLRPEGVLLISSPNPNQYLPGNEFHVHEYTPEEFEQALGRQFANVRLHAQNAWLGSVLSGSDTERAALQAESGAPAVVQLIEGHAPAREGTFTVAMASDRDLPPLSTRVVLGDPFEVRWWFDQVNAAHAESAATRQEGLRNVRELEQRETRWREVGARLLELEQVHARVVSERGDLQEELEDTRFTLAERTHELEQLQWRFERSTRVVAELQESVSWRLTGPLRRIKSLLRSR